VTHTREKHCDVKNVFIIIPLDPILTTFEQTIEFKTTDTLNYVRCLSCDYSKPERANTDLYVGASFSIRIHVVVRFHRELRLNFHVMCFTFARRRYRIPRLVNIVLYLPSRDKKQTRKPTAIRSSTYARLSVH